MILAMSGAPVCRRDGIAECPIVEEAGSGLRFRWTSSSATLSG